MDQRRHAVCLTALLVCFALPNTVLLIIDADRQHLIWLLTSFGLFAAYAMSFRRLSRAIAYALPIFVLMPPIVIYILHYKEFPSSNVIGILFDTSLHEAHDFIEGRATLIIAGIATSTAIWVALLVAARSVKAREPSPDMRWTRATRIAARAALVAAAAVTGLATTPAFSGIDGLDRRGGIDNAHGVRALPFHLNRLANVFPAGPVIAAADFYIGERNRRAWQEKKKATRFDASLSSAETHKRVYVLVIGESSRSDHWQLNGYDRATNPLLSREPNVVYLRDVVTPWTFTLASVPVIASRKSGTDRSRFFAEKSILSLFKEAGFRTYWISNQARPTGIGSEIADISSEADETRWINIAARDYARESSYDIETVGHLATVLAKNEPRQFIVLHLMGSHDAYKSRHPAGFNTFRPSMTDAPEKNDHDVANRALVGNSYDNTILYTDHVLHAAIAALKGSQAEAGLFYVSDHGESLFDGACDFVGHGWTARPNYSVSSLVWLSDRYLGHHHDAHAALLRNAERRLSTENTFDSLAEMADITYPDARPSRSIFSRRFEGLQRRVNVGATSVDWDRASFAGACKKPVARPPGDPRIADLAGNRR